LTDGALVIHLERFGVHVAAERVEHGDIASWPPRDIIARDDQQQRRHAIKRNPRCTVTERERFGYRRRNTQTGEASGTAAAHDARNVLERSSRRAQQLDDSWK